MSDRMDRLGRALGRAASGTTLGHTVRVSPFGGIVRTEAILDAVDTVGLQSLPHDDIADASGNMLFMVGFSDVGGTDKVG